MTAALPYGLLLAVFWTLLLSFTAQADFLLRQFYPAYTNTWALRAVSALLLVVTMLLFRYLALPLVLFGVIVLLFMSIWLWPLHRVAPSAYWFWVNFHAVFFGVCYLFIFAMLSSYLDLPPYSTWQLAWPNALTLAASALLLTLLTYHAHRTQMAQFLSYLVQDNQRLRQLLLFSYYALAYLFFDALGCAFELPYQFLNGFLAGSTLLLGMQFVLFLNHACRIAKYAHFEQEYYQLEQERQQNIQSELHLQKLIETDALTGVYTRRYAMDIMRSLIDDGKNFALAYIDLNGLKLVNDRDGHFAGDQYLITAAQILNLHLRSDDVLARIGGDEFIVVSPGRDEAGLTEVLAMANGELGETMGEDASFSWGISCAQAGKPDLQTLLNGADQQMYAQKKAHKGGYL